MHRTVAIRSQRKEVMHLLSILPAKTYVRCSNNRLISTSMWTASPRQQLPMTSTLITRLPVQVMPRRAQCVGPPTPMPRHLVLARTRTPTPCVPSKSRLLNRRCIQRLTAETYLHHRQGPLPLAMATPRYKQLLAPTVFRLPTTNNELTRGTLSSPVPI